MGSVKLSIDEVLVMKDEGVGRCTGSMGVLKAIASGGIERGILILTNKALIFVPDSKLLSKKKEDVRIPLESIKVSNGIAQIRPAKPEGRDDDYRLTVYCTQSQHVFLFPLSLRLRLKKWVENVNEQITGIRHGWDPEDLGFIDVKKAVSHAIDSAKPVAQGIADVAKPLIPVAAAMASVAPGRTGKFAAAALSAIDAIGKEGLQDTENIEGEQPLENSCAPVPVSAGPSIDEQVDKLKKLKELVECGILTEEEFAAKKREVLGL